MHGSAWNADLNSMKRRSRSKTLAVVNQKGGVGKTTTAVNLGAALAQIGRKVLVVDADPQANATSGLGVEKNSLSGSLFDVLVDGVDLKDVIHRGVAGIPGLDLAPSTLDLSGAETILYTEQNFQREMVLRKAVREVEAEYDYIFIDGPPSLGLLTINILAAAAGLVIPIQCEYYALEGIGQLMRVIDQIKSGINPQLEISVVVLTMQDSRTNLSSQVIEDVRSHFTTRVANTVIPRNIRLSEAPSHGLPITLYDARSKGAMAYQELAQEVDKLQ